jgi:hypothetical protein
VDFPPIYRLKSLHSICPLMPVAPGQQAHWLSHPIPQAWILAHSRSSANVWINIEQWRETSSQSGPTSLCSLISCYPGKWFSSSELFCLNTWCTFYISDLWWNYLLFKRLHIHFSSVTPQYI